MNKALTNPTFDYASVSEDTASKLRYFEGQLSKSRQRVADEAINFGELLHGIQQTLADYSQGTFVAWLVSQGIVAKSAYRAIDAYVEFSGFDNLSKLEVSAMYAVAKNEKAKKAVMKLADKGVTVTHAMAKKLVAETKPAAPPKPDYGKCPNCAGTKWTETDDGVTCSRCQHPHGEPAGDVDDDRLATQRSKTIKTVEALMRAFDDLNLMLARAEHSEAMRDCKRLLEIARAWK